MSPWIRNNKTGGRDAKVFGNTCDVGYELIKDVSGAVLGAYFVGQPK